jgi:hypothetical protein
VPATSRVGRVDGEVAAAGQAGVVAGAFDVRGAQRAGFGGPVSGFGGGGERGLDRERGERVDERGAGALVEAVAGNGGADPAPVFDAVALAEVGGQLPAAALVVADGHAVAAAAAGDDALQQRRAFAGGAGGAVAAVRGGVGGRDGDVAVVLIQGDVTGVGAGDEGEPFPAGVARCGIASRREAGRRGDARG